MEEMSTEEFTARVLAHERMKDISEELAKLRAVKKFDGQRAVRIQLLEIERKKLRQQYMRMVT